MSVGALLCETTMSRLIKGITIIIMLTISSIKSAQFTIYTFNNIIMSH